MLTSVQQAIHKAYVKTAERLTPALATSKYLEEGVLTPDEVLAPLQSLFELSPINFIPIVLNVC